MTRFSTWQSIGDLARILMLGILAAIPVAGQDSAAAPSGTPNPTVIELAPTADTFIRARGARGNAHHGDQTVLKIRRRPASRVLVRFDPTDLDAVTGRLLSAHLELNVEQERLHYGPNGRAVAVHKVTVPWTESGATWNCPHDPVPNAQADCPEPWSGGAFVLPPTDRALHRPGTTGRLRWDVTADVAAALAGEPHHGWLLRFADGRRAGRIEYTSREGSPAERPRLVLEVEPDTTPDTTPPHLAITAPTEVEIVDDSTPAIRLEFDDPETGVEPDSLRLTLDGPNATGFDLTPTCSIEADHAVCEPPPLADGRYTLIATVSNPIGLAAVANHLFVLYTTSDEIDDVEPPSLVLVEPLGDPPPDVRSPTLRFDYSDTGSGIDRTSFELRLDGRDITTTCTLGAASATCQPWPLSSGEHAVAARVLDLAGNPAEVETTLTITATAVDTVRPSLSLVGPARGAVINDTTPTIVVAYADADSGIDRASLIVQVGSLNITSDCNIGPNQAVCASPPLAPGIQRMSASVDDLEGNGLLARSHFEIVLDGSDTTPPTVELLAPGTGPVLADLFETVVLRLDDDDTGVDLTSVVVELDGREISLDCSIAAETRCEVPFVGGDVALVVRLADIAGNAAEQRFDIAVIDRLPDEIPPTLVIDAPAASIGEGPFTVRLEYTDTGGSGIDRASLVVTLDGQPLACTVGAISARCPVDTLAVGSYRLDATLADQDGNTTSVGLEVEVVAESDPPSIALVSPPPIVLGETRPEIVVHYADVASGIDPATFRLSIDGVDITSGCTVAAEAATCLPPPLQAGEHELSAEIHDQRGNVGRTGRVITIQADVGIVIDAPRAGLLTRDATIPVEGSVLQPVERVTVVTVTGEVIEAELDGQAFTADVPLAEGSNVLTAIARVGGAVGLASVTVVRDTTAPRVVIRAPAEGAIVADGEIAVHGEILDPLPGHVDVAAPEIEVGGVAAEVADGTFFLARHLLQPGENRIEVAATDAAGNRSIHAVTVHADATARRLQQLGGQGQRGAAEATLPDPLAVRVVDLAGRPLAGRPVTFTVRRGTGSVFQGEARGRQLEVTSNENGVAEVRFTLGARAGLAHHEVAVSSPGFTAETVFWASATADAPRRIVPVVGGDQRGARVGAIDREYPLPLLAQVFDRHGNTLAGVTVRFRVLVGGVLVGDDEIGASTLDVVTNGDGIAVARYRLGPEEGSSNNVVEASFEGLTEQPAVFVLSGLEPGPEAFTSLSGLVLDNQDQPVPGVTLKIDDVSTTADADGRFTLPSVAAGWIHLKVDGTTTSRPGTWPRLEFALQTIAGRDNSVGMPIRLPQIDVAGGRVVGGPEDVVVPMTGVPGATLTVYADSVTFPDGSKVGEVSFTQVLSDKVPMVAPLGSNFAVAFTIQPPGVHFDPPARVQIPNLGGEPGMVVDIFSFDHDMGEFISAGSASVSDDGRFLQSNPGFGIAKAGWGGCVAPPQPPGDVCSAGGCTFCDAQRKLQHKCNIQCEVCTTFECVTREPKKITASVEGETQDDKVIVGVEQEVEFAPRKPEGTCLDFSYTWRFGDGQESQDERPTHEYEKPGEMTVELIAECDGCPEGGMVADTIKIKVIQLDFEGAFDRLDTASEEKMTVDKKDLDGDGMQNEFYHVLGGVRVRLQLKEHPELKGKVKNLTWSAATGTFHDGFASTAKELKGSALGGPMLDEIFWQGTWATGQDVKVTVTIELDDDREIDGVARMRSREIKPGVSDGDDVAMLRYLLRMFGLSESRSIGYRGRAVVVARAFDGPAKKAVRRHRVRDEIESCPRRTARAFRNCINRADENVDTTVLESLEEHWEDYQPAQEAFASDKQILIHHPQFLTAWVPATSRELQNTYSTTIHNSLGLGVDYDRLTEEWLREEGKLGHWGRQIQTPYRIVLGGADELGSIGYSQITNPNKYSSDTIPSIDPLNLYDPEQNCRALAAFANDKTKLQGMYRAFVETRPASDLTATASFGGYPRLPAPYTDTLKDRLIKGFLTYNGGTYAGDGSVRTDPWPVMLQRFEPQFGSPFEVSDAMGYALDILANAGAPDKRCWTWTDRVITTGSDDVCDSAFLASPFDRALALAPPMPPMQTGPANQVCLVAGEPGNEVLSTLRGNDQYREFSFEFCSDTWHSSTSWADAWRAALPTVLP